MTHSTDYFDLVKNHISAAQRARPGESRRETSFALIDRLIGADTSRIGTLSDDDDEFDLYNELDALPAALRWKANSKNMS